MEIYYIINGKRYMDTYHLRYKLEVNKSELQRIMNVFKFPESEVLQIQNKKLYSVLGLSRYIQKLVQLNDR
jgi:hypothetical protein